MVEADRLVAESCRICPATVTKASKSTPGRYTASAPPAVGAPVTISTWSPTRTPAAMLAAVTVQAPGAAAPTKLALYKSVNGVRSGIVVSPYGETKVECCETLAATSTVGNLSTL